MEYIMKYKFDHHDRSNFGFVPFYDLCGSESHHHIANQKTICECCGNGDQCQQKIELEYRV
jgi:hypothetical protein